MRNTLEPLLKVPIKPSLSVWLGALALLIPAFRNGYPFLYADTGSYITAGFGGIPNGVRPMIYGLFMRHVSLMESLWLVIIVQALIVSWLLHLLLGAFSGKRTNILPLLVIFLLTMTTGVGIVTGMLMPDFLTSVLLLSGGILLAEPVLSRWQRGTLGIMFVFAVSAHHSHALIFAGSLLLILAVYAYQRLRKQSPILQPRRLLLICALGITGYMAIPAAHYAYSGRWFRSESAHVFILNRINEAGLLVPFLNDYCAAKQYEMCAQKDQMPDNFLWANESPANQNGGWAANKERFERIISDFMRSPRYVTKFAIAELENGLVQCFNFEGQIIFRESESGAPFASIQTEIPEELPAARRTMQYREQWSNKELDFLQRWLVFGSLLLLLYFWVDGRRLAARPQVRLMVLFVLIGLVVNAFACAAISMVDMRFQFRVIWLAPVMVVYVLLQNSVVAETESKG